MSEFGKRFVSATMAFLLCSSLIVGCTGDEPAEEKVQPAPVQATALPPAAPTEAPAATDPAAAEDPYEDSLVLLAEGEPDAGPAPLTVQFVVESLVVDEISGARYTWDFGDGSAKSTEAGPTHTYEKPGDYTATVGVVDANGERGWDEVDIIVEEPEGVTP